MLIVPKQMSIRLTEKEWENLEALAKKEGKYLNRQASWLIREALEADEKRAADDFEEEDFDEED